MIKCYLDDKTLLVQFTTTELDHHVANYIRENGYGCEFRSTLYGTKKESVYEFCFGYQYFSSADGRTDQWTGYSGKEPVP